MKSNSNYLKNFCDDLFDRYDEDGSGGLDNDEMKNFLNDLCTEYDIPNLNDEQVQMFFDQHDLDGNGVFDKNEIYAIVEPIYRESEKQKELKRIEMNNKMGPEEIKEKLSNLRDKLKDDVQQSKGTYIPGLKNL